MRTSRESLTRPFAGNRFVLYSRSFTYSHALYLCHQTNKSKGHLLNCRAISFDVHSIRRDDSVRLEKLQALLV